MLGSRRPLTPRSSLAASSSVFPGAFRVVRSAPSHKGSSSPPSLSLGLLQHSPGHSPSLCAKFPQALALFWASATHHVETPEGLAKPERSRLLPWASSITPGSFLHVLPNLLFLPLQKLLGLWYF